MIDVNGERLLTLVEAARKLPAGRGGRPTHTSTIYRWVVDGVRGVRLDGLRLGGRWLTSEAALQRFAVALSADAQPAGTPATPGRSAEAAGRALAAMGA